MDYESLRCPLQRTIGTGDVFTAFTAERAAGFRFDGEIHNFWELVYVERGTIWAAEEQRIVCLHENMYILHKPLAFHRLWCDREGATIRIISFTAHGDGTTRLEHRTGVLPWQLRDLLVATVERASALLDGDCQLGGYVAAGLDYLLEGIAHAADEPLPSESRADFERIMVEINAHYRENITLSELATHCRMSESKLKKVFHSVYDLGVMKYVCKLKMRDAGQMLMDGYSTEEICEALNFTDRNYFSYAFKRETGMTPREYRQKNVNIF